MVISDHTAKAFDIDLQELARLVAEMGGLAEKQVADAVDALARRDTERAQRTVAADPDIDALQAEDDLRSRATERLEPALRVFEGKPHDDPGDPVEAASKEAAIQWLVRSLTPFIQPTGSNCYVRSIFDGFK